MTNDNLRMGYRTLKACLDDLAAAGHLVRLDAPVDPYLEVAEIQRRVYAAGGPAVLYTRPKGCAFPLVSNVFGSIERLRYLFRDTLDDVRRLVELKVDPGNLGRRPWRFLGALRAATHARPRRVSSGPVLANEIAIDQLPRVTCWPNDGGPFITLPQVYTESAEKPGWRHSNLGMYRVQLSGNQYRPNEDVGLHYQIHRGIGVHHAEAIGRGDRLPVSIFVGGPPAMAVAAVMPLPEGLPEIAFAGALGGRRVPLIERPGLSPIHSEADFCITGHVDGERQLPEGPFGDHLGYYSLAHDFPVLRVEHVYHRAGAIWPFTVVGRPPQEDTAFGQFVHELTGPVIPTVVHGVRAVHAVDAAGVHPLLLAIGSERYVPYAERRRPQELLTQANAILGQGQMSLAKYLWIVAQEDHPGLDIHDIPAFFRHVLQRVDWCRDLHFQTRTTIDTLDYSGGALNEGSKVVIAAVGPPRRELAVVPPNGPRLAEGFREPRVALPGVLVLTGPPFSADAAGRDRVVQRFCESYGNDDAIHGFPLAVVVDDSEFAARTLNNFLWVTFTRSNPAADVYGIGSFVDEKHWGCHGSLVIDARSKPHHAPPLVDDPAISRRVDALAAPGGALHGIL
ncbi:MAG TPA: UbiD family decarboxylase [Pirellulales bacterium]|nr:UbiD family decarboxylase [Pirellulales bacterium]